VLQRNRRRCQHVIHIVYAEQRTVYRLTHLVADQIEPRASEPSASTFSARTSAGTLAPPSIQT